jgi:hypothetical protein
MASRLWHQFRQLVLHGKLQSRPRAVRRERQMEFDFRDEICERNRIRMEKPQRGSIPGVTISSNMRKALDKEA